MNQISIRPLNIWAIIAITAGSGLIVGGIVGGLLEDYFQISVFSNKNNKKNRNQYGYTLTTGSYNEDVEEQINVVQTATANAAYNGNNNKIKNGVEELIGDTPMIRIKSLSDATGCEILAKMEMCNPGGSAKDRVALAIIQQAETQDLIRPYHNDVIFEGTSGSTGISLAMLCRAKGYIANICVPDDTSLEKVNMLTQLGAKVTKVRPAGIVDPNQYVNYARKAALQLLNDASTDSRGYFADQFENEANWNAHFHNTGPEIYRQAAGNIDAFVSGAGTGGTIAGVARFLKLYIPKVNIVLADPPGSGFYNKIKFNVMFDSKEKEGRRRRHQVDTLVEGIGLNRITRNFEAGYQYIDDAIRVPDDQSLKMAKYLVYHDGLFVGSSSAVNCVAAYKYAKILGPGHTIVTVLCDSGSRHLSKFWKEANDIDEKEIESLQFADS